MHISVKQFPLRFLCHLFDVADSTNFRPELAKACRKATNSIDAIFIQGQIYCTCLYNIASIAFFCISFFLMSLTQQILGLELAEENCDCTMVCFNNVLSRNCLSKNYPQNHQSFENFSYFRNTLIINLI